MLLRFGAGCTKADIEEHEQVKLFATKIVTVLKLLLLEILCIWERLRTFVT